MQVILYIRTKYNPDFIQKANAALTTSWPLEDIDLVAIFDSSSPILNEAPTLVRIFTAQNNPNNVSMSSLSIPMKGSHYDAEKLFQQFESKHAIQLIIIDKNNRKKADGNKIVKQLFKTIGSIVDIKNTLPQPLHYLAQNFSIFAQNNGQSDIHSEFLSNVIPLNSNKQQSEKALYSSTGTSAFKAVS